MTLRRIVASNVEDDDQPSAYRARARPSQVASLKNQLLALIIAHKAENAWISRNVIALSNRLGLTKKYQKLKGLVLELEKLNDAQQRLERALAEPFSTVAPAQRRRSAAREEVAQQPPESVAPRRQSVAPNRAPAVEKNNRAKKSVDLREHIKKALAATHQRHRTQLGSLNSWVTGRKHTRSEERRHPHATGKGAWSVLAVEPHSSTPKPASYPEPKSFYPFQLIATKGEGNCYFNAVSLQIKGSDPLALRLAVSEKMKDTGHYQLNEFETPGTKVDDAKWKYVHKALACVTGKDIFMVVEDRNTLVYRKYSCRGEFYGEAGKPNLSENAQKRSIYVFYDRVRLQFSALRPLAEVLSLSRPQPQIIEPSSPPKVLKPKRRRAFFHPARLGWLPGYGPSSPESISPSSSSASPSPASPPKRRSAFFHPARLGWLPGYGPSSPAEISPSKNTPKTNSLYPFKVIATKGEGNCYFNAVSLQIKGSDPLALRLAVSEKMKDTGHYQLNEFETPGTKVDDAKWKYVHKALACVTGKDIFMVVEDRNTLVYRKYSCRGEFYGEAGKPNLSENAQKRSIYVFYDRVRLQFSALRPLAEVLSLSRPQPQIIEPSSPPKVLKPKRRAFGWLLRHSSPSSIKAPPAPPTSPVSLAAPPRTPATTTPKQRRATKPRESETTHKPITRRETRHSTQRKSRPTRSRAR